jgi:hypothetical protein
MPGIAGKNLKIVFPLNLEISSWEELKEEFKLRNTLIHEGG